MGYSITITNKDNKKFRFYDGEVKSASYRRVTKLLKQSLPDAEAEDAIIINLGIEKTISFPFKLTNTTATTNDAAVATHTTTVYTPAQKLAYLDDTFVTNGIEDLYTIEVETDNGNLTKVGILEDLTIDFMAENPGYNSGSITIGIGGGSQSG